MNSSQRPNVVQIVSNDMGYGDFDIISECRVKTSNLDRLVQERAYMQQHYSGSLTCSPARASLLTGLVTAPVGGSHAARSILT